MSRSSSRSSPRQESNGEPDIGSTSGASGMSSPVSSAITWPSERIPKTRMPGTIAASAACGSGT